jgi:hypothetical protein
LAGIIRYYTPQPENCTIKLEKTVWQAGFSWRKPKNPLENASGRRLTQPRLPLAFFTRTIRAPSSYSLPGPARKSTCYFPSLPRAWTTDPFFSSGASWRGQIFFCPVHLAEAITSIGAIKQPGFFKSTCAIHLKSLCAILFSPNPPRIILTKTLQTPFTKRGLRSDKGRLFFIFFFEFYLVKVAIRASSISYRRSPQR